MSDTSATPAPAQPATPVKPTPAQPAQPVNPAAPVTAVTAVTAVPAEAPAVVGADPAYPNRTVPSADTAPEAEQVPVERPEDPSGIGVVMPGDRDGMAALAVRSIGFGDSGVYEGAPVDVIKLRQAQAGLEPNGIIVGPTWGLVLRELRQGEAGHEVRILRTLYGLNPDGVYDQELVDLVGERFNSSDWGQVLQAQGQVAVGDVPAQQSA